MSPSTRPGFAVLVVADSDRPAPDALAEILEHPVGRCPTGQVRRAADVYQALASLIVGPRPAVVILNVDELDVGEFDFFDHVRRVAPETAIRVVTTTGDGFRFQEALRRGAEPLTGFDLDESIALVEQAGYAAAAVGRSQAGRATPPKDAPGPAGLAGRSAVEAAETDGEQDTIPFSAVLGARRPPKAARELVAGSTQPVLTPVEPPAASARSAEDAGGSAVPNVRLVRGEEQNEAPAIAFPWAPSPSRPKRTPPGGQRAAGEPVSPPGTEGSSPSAPSGPAAGPTPDRAGEPGRSKNLPINVELTREEIAALLRGPSSGQGRMREGQG